MKLELEVSNCPETGLKRIVKVEMLKIALEKELIAPMVQLIRLDGEGNVDRMSDMCPLHSKIKYISANQLLTKGLPQQQSPELQESLISAQSFYQELFSLGDIDVKNSSSELVLKIKEKVALWYGSPS